MSTTDSHTETRFARLARRGRTALNAGARACADFIVPPVCLACQQPVGSHSALCASCWQGITFIRPPLCDRLGIPLPFDPGGTVISAAAAAQPPLYDRARAVAIYDGVMRDLIHGFKYADRHDARRLFGRWLAEAGASLLTDADLVVPVPLNSIRLLSRRFNQAAVLAQEISARTGVTYAPQALARIKRTASQVGLTHDERRLNVRAAFAVPEPAKGQIMGRRIVLVDDVITTGATVEACARALQRAGAARVDILALALVANPASMST
jgi:ComF family protein